MENRNVGWILIGLSVLFVIVILLFNTALKDIVATSCSLEHDADSCPMYDTISKQTFLALGIVGLLIIVGFVLIFSKPEEKIVVKTKTIKEKKKKIDVSKLDKKEKEVVELLQKENGGMFQADLMEKLEIGKVGLTRLLDKLEAKQIVERKRRGMNNIVVLKS